MLIKDIELNNFRIYKGSNKVHILPSTDKNIVVISGKNGYGKTTFLMSIVWCLYGRQMGKVDTLYQKEISDQGGYSKYIGNSLNRSAKVDGSTNFSVSITFLDVKIPEITCNEIKITRSYDIHGGEKIEVLIDGSPNGLIKDLATKNQQNGEEIFIRDFILPIEVAKFFFFDAEKIVSLAEINSSEQRRLLSRAYTEVLGIKKYEDLKDNLESIQDEYRKKSAKPEEKTEFNQIMTNIKNADIEVENLESKIEKLKEERSEKQNESNDIQRKLIQEGNQITLEQLEELKREETELESDMEKLQDELKDLHELIPFGLTGEVLIEVNSQLKYEYAKKKNEFRQADVKGKTSAVLDDLEEEKKKLSFIVPTDIRNFYEFQIKKLIKKHFFPDDVEIPQNFTPLHDLSNSETNEFNTLITQLTSSFREKFENLHSRYVTAKDSIGGIRRKIGEAEKNAEDTHIAEWRFRKDVLDKRVSVIDTEIENLRENIGEIKNRIKAYKQRQEELRKIIDDSTKYGAREKKAQEIIHLLKNFIKDFKEEKKKSLEEGILGELNTLMHKEKFIKKVVVDISLSDDVDINLFDERNEKREKGSLSMGERQIYASSLLKTLVDESDIEFPVFIDSPMQKFDDTHARNIIQKFYPKVSDQVVIFPLIYTEITQDKFTLLKQNISQSYLIRNLNADSSEFVQTKPEKLIDTYNEIEHAN